MMTAARRWIRAACICMSALGASTAGCTPHEPPMPDASPWVAAPQPSLSPASAWLPATRPPSPSASSPAPADSGLPKATALATAGVPASGDAADSTLGQTHDKPSASGAAFQERVASLWQAIVRDDPDLAMPFFFPLSAYEIVKDVGDPAADWNRRLVNAYRRDIHTLHGRLDGDADRATLVSLDVPQGRAHWVEPGEEWNKVGYFRVFGSKLRFAVDGEARTLEVKSLISWRGEWFVVHLGAVR